MDSEKKIKIYLSPHCSVNYETIMTSKLWMHVFLLVTVCKAMHLQFGFSGHANVFMMQSACFFALRDYLEPIKELYSSSFQSLCQWIYSGGLTLPHQKVQLHLVPPFNSTDFSQKIELSHSHSCIYNLIKEKLTHCFDSVCYYLVSVW